jgi:signal transduction histidine kinase/CheY-like chemotaxis protein
MGRAWQGWQHSLATGEPYEVEYRLRHRSGEYRWVLGRALPLRDEQGRITRWMGTCTDIHEQVIARELLHREAQRKDEFLAMLAHELRNPLAPIRAAASVLPAAAGDAARTSQLAEVVERQVTHMTRLVDDLLDVSRVTRGLAKLDLEQDDLKSIVANAVEQVRPLMEKRRHALATWMVPAPVPVRADRTRLVQVFANLLNNAAKYTPDGGHIELRVDVRDGDAVVCVRDNGSGIDAQLLPHVFDLFSQGTRDPDRSQGGLGIGLALARSITQLHGGHIVALSNGRGQGSEFIVRLPMTKPAAEPRASSLSSPPSAGKRNRCHVVVVDDNVDAARTIALALEIAGHEVTTCHTAAAAFAVAVQGPAPVYIIDIGLPDIPGYDLAQELRRNPETAHATLIALTGYGRPEDRERSKEAGFDRHLVKPVDVGELRELIDGIANCPAQG